MSILRPLHAPAEGDLVYGQWGPEDDDGAMVEGSPEKFQFDCNTQCCLVGHVAIAFGADGYEPFEVDAVPDAVKFLSEFCKRAGFPVPEGCTSVASHASDVFEDRPDTRSCGATVPRGHPGLAVGEARQLWAETATHLGYTVGVR